MPKHLNILIFFVYSLILACFFQGHTAKDISAVADRYCQPLGHGKELRLESCPFSRVLRLKGCLTAGGGPITHPAPLAPSPLLKKKGDICYFTIPPGKGGSLDLSAETAGTAQACVYNYFSRSKGVYVALFNDYPDIAPVHPLGGYFLFFLLLTLAFLSVLSGSAAAYSLFMAPVVILVSALTFIPLLLGIKVYLAFPVFVKLMVFSFLAGLVYQLQKKVRTALVFLLKPAVWPAPSIKEGCLWGLGITAAAAVFYWPMFSHLFRHDEWFYFFTFRGGSHPLLKYIDWQLFLPSDRIIFRPIHHGMLALNMLLFGGSYVPPHVLSFLKHLSAAALLLAGLWRIYPHRLAFLFTTLFALLSTQLDAVAWAHVDAYVLTAVFVLGATLLFLETTAGKLSPAKGFGLSSLLLLAAMLTTELAFLAPFILFFFYRLFFREPGPGAGERDKAAWLYFAPLFAWALLFALHLWKIYPDFTMSPQSAQVSAIRSVYNSLLSFCLASTGIFPVFTETFSTDKVYVKTGFYWFILTAGLIAAAAFRFRKHIKINREAGLYAAMAFAPWLIVSFARASYINDMFTCWLPDLGLPTHYAYVSNAFILLTAYALIGESLAIRPRLSAAVLLGLCLWHGALVNVSLRRVSAELLPGKSYYDQLAGFVSLHRAEKDFSFKLTDRLQTKTPFNWYFASFPETFYGRFMSSASPRYIVNYDYGSGALNYSLAGDHTPPPALPAWPLEPREVKPAFTNSTGISFMRLPAGIPAAYIGVTEVTQRQWSKIMGNNPSPHADPKMPVSDISWVEANEFIGRLNAAERTKTYRLPNEQERDALGSMNRGSGLKELKAPGQNQGSSTKNGPAGATRSRRATICAWLSGSISTGIYNYPDTPRLCSGLMLTDDGTQEIYSEAYPPSRGSYNTGLRVVKDIR